MFKNPVYSDCGVDGVGWCARVGSPTISRVTTSDSGIDGNTIFELLALIRKIVGLVDWD